MGAMGNPIIQTLNIDKLAAAGALFANAYVTTSILAMAGVPVPKQMQGVDLFAVLQNKIPERNDFFYQHYFLGGSHIPRVEGIVTKDFKYMNYVEHNYEELFESVHDPHETTNLGKDHKLKMKLEELRPFHEFRLPSHSIYL